MIKQYLNPIKPALRQLKTGLCQSIGKFVDIVPNENLVIFSDPRGGSTWMAELIGQLPKTALLWEPLNVARVDHFKRLNFSLRQYIPEDENWPQAREAFKQLFRGKVLNYYTCSFSSPFDFLFAERMVVKFCRGNALLPWLTRFFNFTYQPIFLVRHPFAVAASQLSHPAWASEFKGYNIPDSPFNEIYLQHSDFLLSLKHKYEALVATWCLTNLIPLRNPRNNRDWITVYYENLILNPEQQLGNIFNRWNTPLPASVLKHITIPSATTRDATFRQSREKQLSKWKRFFDKTQTERMTAVLQYFGVTEYTTDIFPHLD